MERNLLREWGVSMDVLEAVKDVICTVGFPIAVTGFLLWERMTTTKELTKTIANNTQVISLLIDKLEGKEG